jgi:transposase
MKTAGKRQPGKANGKRQQQIRMDDALKARIRGYQQQVHRDTGLEVSFSSAVRSLIEKGLEAAQ